MTGLIGYDWLALTGDDQLSADPLALTLWLDLLAMTG
jgi:hypothetical protein